jgi:transposase
VVRRWARLFNEGLENVHDEPRSGRPSVVNEDFVRVIEEKIRESRPLRHFPSIFLRFHGHFFTKLCIAAGIILR